MRKKNIVLFAVILAVALIWGAVYWYVVQPIIDPR